MMFDIKQTQQSQQKQVFCSRAITVVSLSLMMVFSAPSFSDEPTEMRMTQQPKVESSEEAMKQTSQESVKKTENSLAPLNLKTVLLDKPTREKIDRQRAAYLNPELEKEQVVIPPSPSPRKGVGKPKKQPIYLPYKLTVSAVVKKPDGTALVRINDKFNKTRSKHITIDELHTGPQGAMFHVIDKDKVVPVGQTLLPRKMQTVDNYKIAQQEKKNTLPKTKDKATENRLKDVQIITGDVPVTKP